MICRWNLLATFGNKYLATMFCESIPTVFLFLYLPAICWGIWNIHIEWLNSFYVYYNIKNIIIYIEIIYKTIVISYMQFTSYYITKFLKHPHKNQAVFKASLFPIEAIDGKSNFLIYNLRKLCVEFHVR